MARARESLDCLKRFREHVTAAGFLEPSALDAINIEVADLIQAAVADAKQAPVPTAADLSTDVYVSY